jgi:hypothetical protein
MVCWGGLKKGAVQSNTQTQRAQSGPVVCLKGAAQAQFGCRVNVKSHPKVAQSIRYEVTGNCYSRLSSNVSTSNMVAC